MLTSPRFQAKSIALKSNVVRSTLLPFLRNFASHPSNHALRSEDLDRRTSILNKWWTGLLDMLVGRNNQSLSGIDRPVILDGISGIMERPEWRQAPSPLSPLSERTGTPRLPRSTSTASLTSSTSDFLSESVHHYVQTILVQNLITQMSYVVDRMALRSVAASMVTFCGKTCAYAFYFCPGVADMLVRLWKPSPDLLRRVLADYGISRFDKRDDVSKHISLGFPPAVQSLRFTSLSECKKAMRQAVLPPLGTASFNWHGPWTKRWQGMESELFYVFAKHYHVLATDYLPPDVTDEERICAPGTVMVHAQLLANMDATIYRLSNMSLVEDSGHGASSITFDDVLSEADASAHSLALLPTNATRMMAENRLIMLLRDFLSERSSPFPVARRIFADSFARLLRVAAQRVSIYDYNACFTLCDFLEEAIGIYVRYEHSSAATASTLDWPFWMSVFKRMVQSENTHTEIKLYSFLYSIWSVIASDPNRKLATCLEFLLEKRHFERTFNHFCPMVRSYYMRLLCWRIARLDGEATEQDL